MKTPLSYYQWQLKKLYRRFISNPLFHLIHRKHDWEEWREDTSIPNIKFSRVCRKKYCYACETK